MVSATTEPALGVTAERRYLGVVITVAATTEVALGVTAAAAAAAGVTAAAVTKGRRGRRRGAPG